MRKNALLLFILSVFAIVQLQAQGTWLQKADKPGDSLFLPVAFSIGNVAYIGIGARGLTTYNEMFWEYDPQLEIWTQKASFVSGRTGVMGFAIGNKGYAGGGQSGTGPNYNDWYEYDPATNTWTQKANMPGGNRMFGVGFAIGNKGYIGTGTTSGFTQLNDLWEYNPATDSWITRANIGTVARRNASAFSIDNKGYVALGQNSSNAYLDDLWEFNPTTNTWTQKANFAGSARGLAASFSVEGKGYISTGIDANGIQNDLWSYDPSTNSWFQENPLPGPARYAGSGFSVNGKGYVGFGFDNSLLMADIFEFTPVSIPPVASFTVSDTMFCEGGYTVVTNTSSGSTPDTIIWITPGATIDLTDINAPVLTYNVAGSYDVKMIISNAGGTDSLELTNYITVHPNPVTQVSSDTTVCLFNPVQLQASGGDTYSWSPSNGLSDPDIADPVATPVFSTNYKVTVTTNEGCSAIDSVYIEVLSLPQLIVSANDQICQGDTIQLTASGADNYTWSPSTGLDNPNIAEPLASPSTTTTYTVTSSNAEGCENSETVTITVLPAPFPEITQSGDTLFAGVTGNTYAWFLNGDLIAGATGEYIVITQSGSYQLTVTYDNGCTRQSQEYFAIKSSVKPMEFIENIKIYPNPAENRLTISGTMDVSQIKLEIVNLLGQTLFSDIIYSENSSFEKMIDVSRFESGSYFIILRFNDQTMHYSFVRN